MLRIDKANKALVALERKTMRESGYWERRDVQEMICRSPRSFCEELDEDIYIVGSEVQPTDFVQDRIDLLGVDPDPGANLRSGTGVRTCLRFDECSEMRRDRSRQVPQVQSRRLESLAECGDRQHWHR
jgi:hypothetical protein